MKKNEKKYVVVRTYSAGVSAGFLEKKDGAEVTLSHARKIWYWSGAASLYQLAQKGTSNPSGCKFPCEVNSVTLLGVIEILDTTPEAEKSIREVPEWKA